MVKKSISVFLFLFISLISSSQDVIIKKDFSKIYCTIVNEDSLAVYYNIDANRKKNLSIAKSDILKYYRYSSTSLRNSKYKDYNIEKGDTIVLSKKYEFEFKGELLLINEVVNLMVKDTLAYKEIIKAKKYHDGNWVTQYLGFTISLFPIAASGKSIPFGGAVILGSSIIAVTYIISIPLNKKFKKHAKAAVKLFNEKHR